MIGNVSTETKLTTAVYDIDSAVSSDILQIIFDVTLQDNRRESSIPQPFLPSFSSPCEMVNATMGSNTI